MYRAPAPCGVHRQPAVKTVFAKPGSCTPQIWRHSSILYPRAGSNGKTGIAADDKSFIVPGKFRLRLLQTSFAAARFFMATISSQYEFPRALLIRRIQTAMDACIFHAWWSS